MRGMGYVLEVVKFHGNGDSTHRNKYPMEHIGYMDAVFKTKKNASDYYAQHNPHMRAMGTFSSWKSDWDPDTLLMYIVRTNHCILPGVVPPFDPNDAPVQEREDGSGLATYPGLPRNQKAECTQPEPPLPVCDRPYVFGPEADLHWTGTDDEFNNLMAREVLYDPNANTVDVRCPWCGSHNTHSASDGHRHCDLRRKERGVTAQGTLSTPAYDCPGYTLKSSTGYTGIGTIAPWVENMPPSKKQRTNQIVANLKDRDPDRAFSIVLWLPDYVLDHCDQRTSQSLAATWQEIRQHCPEGVQEAVVAAMQKFDIGNVADREVLHRAEGWGVGSTHGRQLRGDRCANSRPGNQVVIAARRSMDGSPNWTARELQPVCGAFAMAVSNWMLDVRSNGIGSAVKVLNTFVVEGQVRSALASDCFDCT